MTFNDDDDEMGGKELNSVEQERDLVVIIHQNGKSSAQCYVAAMKANQVLGMIKRNIKWKNMGVMVRLYKALLSETKDRVLRAGMESKLGKR